VEGVDGVIEVNGVNRALLETQYAKARVLVTGHTGFKGSWLSEWLLALGADVTGYALEPDTSPALFAELDLENRLRHVVGDVRDFTSLERLVKETQPRFVFHLAAQPLVRRSYREPRYTWETNVLGTVHLLEALRAVQGPCAAVIVTSDKCYENQEWCHGYRENDPLGGHDPYSSSKAAAEVAVSSWRRSFLSSSPRIRVASVRAGNVIGGGDWSEDRIVPDCVRALMAGQPIRVRNPFATRPWQHVLEPTRAYLMLAAALAACPEDERLDGAFNVGPGPEANRPVGELVAAVLGRWPGAWIDTSGGEAPHEASLLHLDSAKIRSVLGWTPAWGFEEAIHRTIGWYRAVVDGDSECGAIECTRRDIEAYAAATSARFVAADGAAC
jgi:CDP-glucose 4,6-dehydratase